ncbi:MAG: tetratricopeptide repeat protein, partial [Gemmataceae bacterium]|nr:tetratricopeptide repeat protein [Gemmataceae bacterium]
MLPLLLAFAAAPHAPASSLDAERRLLVGNAFAARTGKADLAACEKALAAIRAGVGEWHPRHAHGLEMLAIVLEHRGAFARSLPLRQRILLIRRRVDPDGLAYAEALDRLGSVLGELGRLEEAERHLREALRRCEALMGSRSPETAARLNNLALVVKARGRTAEAAVLLERAYAGMAGLHVTHNLALCYHDLGDYARALRRYAQAEFSYDFLRKMPDGVREDVPWAVCLTALGSLHHEMGDFDEADRAFSRAAEVFVGRLARHPSRGTLLNNRAMLAKAQGKPREALKLLEEGLALEEGMRGPDSPEVAVKRHNIASVLIELGDLDRAEKVMEQAQAARRKADAERHPYYGNGLVELALIAEKRGHLARALELDEQASAVYRAASGPETFRLAASRRAEARLYLRRGDRRQAERRIGQALAVARLDLER